MLELTNCTHIDSGRKRLNGIVVEITIRQGTHSGTELFDQLLDFVLVIDHQTIRVTIPILVVVAHLGRKQSTLDTGYLRTREALDEYMWLHAPVGHEVVEVTPGCAQDDELFDLFVSHFRSQRINCFRGGLLRQYLDVWF